MPPLLISADRVIVYCGGSTSTLRVKRACRTPRDRRVGIMAAAKARRIVESVTDAAETTEVVVVWRAGRSHWEETLVGRAAGAGAVVFSFFFHSGGSGSRQGWSTKRKGKSEGKSRMENSQYLKGELAKSSLDFQRMEGRPAGCC